MATERNFKVYMHKNKTNGKVYIGITGQKLEDRWREGKGYKGCRAFSAAIKKYGWDNFEHILLLDNLTKEEAEEKEIELIKKYKSNKKGYGYNISNGGSTIGRHSEETKKILSEKAKGRKSKNAKKVICENIVFENADKCADHYGIKASTLKSWLTEMTMPKEWFDKGLRREGKTMEDYTIQRGRHGNPKPVICENTEYRSCDECSKHYGINVGTMKNWLNGRNPMPKEWYEKGLRYKEKSMNEYVIQKATDEEPIICEDKTFNSFKECSDYYNIDINLLRKWLRCELNMPQDFYDMGLRHKSKTMDYYTRRTRDFSGVKQVVCEEMIFENIVSCADYYKVKASNLASYLTGRTTMPKEWYEKGLRFVDKSMDDYKVRPDSYIGENSPLPTNPITCDGKIFYSIDDFLNTYPEAKNVFNWLNGNNSMPKKWEERGLKYLDGHTDDIIIYQDEDYWERVHKNRSESHKGYIPANSFKVYCDGMVFDTVTKCADYYGVNAGTMKGWLNGNSTMPQEWYDKELRREDKEMSDYKVQTQSKSVICDGVKFKSITDCAKHHKISDVSIQRYLNKETPMPKKFYDMKLHYEKDIFEECGYEMQNEYGGNSKIVVCEGIEYSNVKPCAEHYGVHHGTMSGWLGHRNKMPKKFYDLGLHYKDEPMENYEFTNKVKRVICEEIIFESIKECANHYKVKNFTMSRWLNGDNSMPQEFKDKGLRYYNN